eukprot:885653_1
MCDTPFDCCMCNSIECGSLNNPCQELRVHGNQGVYGVQSIKAIGDPFSGNGVSIDCQGIQSCKNTNIHGMHVNVVDCEGHEACANSTMTIEYPKNGFLLECAGESACEGLKIDILLPTWDKPCPNTQNRFLFNKIMCNSNNACEGLEITVRNEGCNNVIIQNLDCTHSNSCNNGIFNLIGDVRIDNCLCGVSCNTA